MGNVINTSEQNFGRDVIELSQSKLVLVDFWAPWCGPCKSLAQVLDEVASELEDSVQIIKLNVDDSQELPVQYGVRSIPTIVLIKDKEVIAKQSGALSKTQLLEFISQAQ